MLNTAYGIPLPNSEIRLSYEVNLSDFSQIPTRNFNHQNIAIAYPHAYENEKNAINAGGLFSLRNDKATSNVQDNRNIKL